MATPISKEQDVPPNVDVDADANSIDKALEKEGMVNDDLKPVSSALPGQVNDYTEAEYKKLTRKIDYYLIPIMFFMYGIQQTDKTSVSIQALFGMTTDLGMVGQDYQWLTTIFYLTYLIGEFPSTWLMQKYKIGRVLTLYIVGWSICLICISACNTWSQVMALRALQGFFECNVSPGFLLITGAFYRTSEHANRSLFWQSSLGFFTIFCNLALYGIARQVSNYGGIAAWRTITLFLGSLTLVGAIFAYFTLGSPNEVMWLTPEEKKMANLRVMENQIGEESTSRKWNWDHVKECAWDPQVYFQFVNTFLACIPNGGITTFTSQLFVTFGFDAWGSMLYQLPRQAMYIFAFIFCAFYLRKFQNQRMYVMIFSCVLPFVGMLMMSLLPNEDRYKWIKWGMFDITCVFSLAIYLGWSMITSNVAGTTKRTVVSSVTLVGYCVGNMVGTQVFRTEDAPRYLTGTIACSACFGLEIITIILWRLWYMYQNRRRDRLCAEQGLSKEEQQRRGMEMGEQDTTDMKNPYFRYSM